MTTATTDCAGCGLPLDYDNCPNCGRERKRPPWTQRRTAPVVEHLRREALDRDEHQCRARLSDGERCPRTTGVDVRYVGTGPIEFAHVDELIVLCRTHRAVGSGSLERAEAQRQ